MDSSDAGFKPRVLICVECGEEFVFTVEAQTYFAERGYADDPLRCKTCHTKFRRSGRHSSHEPKSPVTKDEPRGDSELS